MRIFKRESPAYWVDIYFFGSKVADAFNPDGITGVLNWSRIGPTQVQIFTTKPKLVEQAADAHEKAHLDLIRQERLDHLASLSTEKTSPGGIENVITASALPPIPPKPGKKKGGCGCGKK